MSFPLYLSLIVPLLSIAGFFTYASWKIGKNPDLTIFNKGKVPREIYVLRWYLILNKLFAVFVHEFQARDTDLPHNHIGPMVSLVIGGSGVEEFYNVLGVKTGERKLKPWRLYFRGTSQPHLIHSSKADPLQTLVIAWIYSNKNWGFFAPGGVFYPAKTYCRSNDFNKST